MTLEEKIVAVAKSYIGQKEKPNNSGFINVDFENKHKKAGWIAGFAWCAFFSEVVWKEAFTAIKPEAVPLLDKYFSGSTIQTFKNFKKSPEFPVRPTPKLGAVAIWQHGTGTTGHAGIVTSFNEKTFKCVEGNTSEAGSREGTIVRENTRELIKPYSAKQLNLLGFIWPTMIIKT